MDVPQTEHYIRILEPPQAHPVPPAPVPGPVPAKPRPKYRRWRTAGVAGCVLAGAASLAVADSPPPPVTPGFPLRVDAGSDLDAAAQASRAFLARWVDDDGRVVRRDQGNDTVSEGQAYGMLIAVGVADQARFESIWGWTRTHLLRPDGLLAWRWAHGKVADAEPAADADLDAARALVRAGAVFNRPDWTESGVMLGRAVLGELTGWTGGSRVLLPGAWATRDETSWYNPSYASPAAFAVLARASGDPRWIELDAGSRSVTQQLLQESPLPPDWALLNGKGVALPAAGPGSEGGKLQRYSYDAARVAVRLAESCNSQDRSLSGMLAARLPSGSPLAAELSLSGSNLGTDRNPVAYVARASAFAAAGRPGKARADLAEAATLNSAHPTYYGAAWLALGRLMLASPALGGCPPLAEP
ncbi:hypothetical protein KIH31_04880 [Paenarthrobacter sp. DKR-5]|uniref:glycosyl hydrolase family 8 n=1 Tax=Paenarthrobacter sp. DKR-5 TaxID=2835535 RepID=UPI001BDC0B64|nr:glycosyl hydrolase family 8 [Paenarthrobacter sp. DKR-5]MBT1001932.1 hypothetical protein [Paenarthrobacter sp. DKR-5]